MAPKTFPFQSLDAKLVNFEIFFAPLMLTAKSGTRKSALTPKEHFVYSQILNGQL